MSQMSEFNIILFTSFWLWLLQIPHHEPAKEIQVTQPVEEEEAVSPLTDGQPAEAPYEEEQEDVEEEEEPEEPGPELEAPLEDVSGEPVESGTTLKAFFLPLKGALMPSL